MDTQRDILSGRVLDKMVILTLDELCRTCRVQREWVLELVSEGILEPQGRDRNGWYFDGTSLQRVQKVQRLQQDLGVNLAGAALVLDLMEEIRVLRARLRLFE